MSPRRRQPPCDPPRPFRRSRPSRHLAQSVIRLQQWPENHYTRSLTMMRLSSGQGHDARALMGKPDAHIHKHTHTCQTNVCTYNKDIHHSHSPAKHGGHRGRTQFVDNNILHPIHKQAYKCYIYGIKRIIHFILLLLSLLLLFLFFF